MTEPYDLDNEEEEKEKKKKEGEESGAPSRGEASVSPGFFEYMAQIGASKTLVAEILRSWRHLKGESLLRRISEFVKGLVKSAHVEVDIERDKNFSLIDNFIRSSKEVDSRAHTAKHRHTLHQPGANLDHKPKAPT